MTPAVPDVCAVEALLAFWADAGVDACLLDAPVDRLAAPPPSTRPAAPSPEPGRPAARRPAADLNPPPDDLSGVASLEALTQAVRARFGRAAVGFEGAAPARLMVVGDAPTAQDEAEGRPFTGARGALLRALLAAAGLGDGVLYGYTAFRRPAGGGDPEAAAQAQAAPFLARAAALVAPEAVLLLGACAARAVAGVEGPILKRRGQWAQWSPPGAPAVPALVTLGPDFLLAHPASKKQAWGDVLSLAARLLPEPPAS